MTEKFQFKIKMEILGIFFESTVKLSSELPEYFLAVKMILICLILRYLRC